MVYRILLTALGVWFGVIASAGALMFLLACLFGTLRHGSLIKAIRINLGRVRQVFADLRGLSLRRLWALTRHTVIESIRRRVLFAFIVFGVLFLFAGWYIDTTPTEQVKIYVSFVFRSASVMMFVIAVLLGAMSVPADIQNRTIHTVVTKPVRRLEIVFGRILGFSLICTLMVFVIGLTSYVYLRRSISGTIEQYQTELAAAERTGSRERVKKLRDDIAQLSARLTARRPILGGLQFFDEKGEPKASGTNVGYEDFTRQYIPGGGVAHASWYFSNLPVERLREQQSIPLEVSFEVFRTTKGEVGKGVLAQLRYVNPDTKVTITDYPFYVREFYTQSEGLSPTRVGLSEAERTDVQKKVAKVLEGCTGKLEIQVYCLSPSQYLGVAFDDLYILLDHASFALNFAKGLAGLVSQIIVVISLAVSFSTFLSGPVALLATLTAIVGGMFMEFVQHLALNINQGGGMLESLIRILLHENLQKQLEPEPWVRAALFLDHYVFNKILLALTFLLPDLRQFNLWPAVANGFDVPILLIVQNLVVALSYAVPFALAGYVALQAREIAR